MASWSTARIVMGLGVGAGCGLKFFMTRSSADAEDFREGPNYLDNLRECPYLHWDWNWDRRATLKKPKAGQVIPEIDEKQYSAHSRHIICVTSGLCFKLEGSPICGLQKEGRYQVINLTLTLMGLGQHFRNIYYSQIKQDQETAQMIFEGMKKHQPHNPPTLIKEEMLEEGPTVVPIPLTSSGLPNRANLFIEQCKIEAGFRKLFHRLDKSDTEDVFDIIVAQPDVIKYFICRALQLPEALSRFHLNWASITMFTISGNGVVQAFSIGDSGFQPPNLLKAK
uniref:Serine/threonine-protein phosphatase PGAM5, mitochondrial n=1 Tax=Lygus hesperus TaxID=30085 RepID=A0A0A9ZGW7_LYGHE